MKKVSRFIRPFAGMIAVGILLKAVGSFADLFLPYLLSFIIDDGIGTQNTPGDCTDVFTHAGNISD